MAEIRISDLGSLNFYEDWKLLFQIQERYALKYLTTDTIRVQFTTSSDIIAFPEVRLFNAKTNEITTLIPVKVHSTDEYSVYNVTLSNLSEGCYVFQFYLSEVLASAPFSIHEELENSRLFEYTNEKNDHETVFAEPFYFRVEGVFLPQALTPQVESNNFRDQRYIQHLLSASPYNIHTLSVGGKFGAPNYVEDKLNRILSCTSVLIDGEQYARAEGTSTEKEVFDPAYPLYRYKLQVEKAVNGEKVIPLNYSVRISGRVEDVISKEGVSGASVVISFGDYQIAKTSTNQAGEFSYLWRISESEYNNLVAGKGSVLRWIAQKDGYTTKESQTNIPTDYRDAVRQGISTTIQLLAKGNTTASDIPIGFNMRGMTITFADKDKPMTDRGMFDNEPLIGSAGVPYNVPGNFQIQSTFDGGSGGEDAIEIYMVGASGSRRTTIWNRGTGWSQDSYTFPSDTNFIVGINSFVPAVGDSWGWDSAIVTGDPYPLTADKVPVGFNLRGKTIEFQGTDRPMDDEAMIYDNLGLFGVDFFVNASEDGTAAGGVFEIRANINNTHIPIWDANSGWIKTSLTFSNDRDYIITRNNTRPAVGDSWGWNYAIIKD